MCLDRGTVGAKVCTCTFLQTVLEIAIVLFLIAVCSVSSVKFRTAREIC